MVELAQVTWQASGILVPQVCNSGMPPHQKKTPTLAPPPGLGLGQPRVLCVSRALPPDCVLARCLGELGSGETLSPLPHLPPSLNALPVCVCLSLSVGVCKDRSGVFHLPCLPEALGGALPCDHTPPAQRPAPPASPSPQLWDVHLWQGRGPNVGDWCPVRV